MRNIQLLDCTLRDGGYINDWKFGHNNLLSIFERLVNSGVEIIEVGFLDDRRPFDFNRSIMPDTLSASKIWAGIKKRPPMVVGMIDYGTCSIDNIQPCCESFLDGIRVIFKKHLMKEAMEFCRELKAKGYIVFSQLVSITSYNDVELMELINIANDVKPYAVSIVDTYGLLRPDSLLYYYDMLDDNLEKHIQIGFHGHNNFQLAYANSLAFLGKKTDRNIVIDGTLFGMGKSAGNAPIELLAMSLNDDYGKHYQINSMMEAIEESISKFHKEYVWGYQPFFFMCALNNCHPNYLTYLKEKNNLSITSINKILSKIEPEEKKLLYDKIVVEELYEKYKLNWGTDSEDRLRLGNELKMRDILLVGPGKNSVLQVDCITSYIEKKKPYIISVNFIPDNLKVNCVFVTNPERYLQMESKLKTLMDETNGVEYPKLLALSTLECKAGDFDFVIDRAGLIEPSEIIIDNSFLMLIKLLENIGVDKVACAGFDGYSETEDNYLNPKMEYSFVKSKVAYFNSHMRNVIHEYRKNMDIQFITYSAYDKEDDITRAAY